MQSGSGNEKPLAQKQCPRADRAQFYSHNQMQSNTKQTTCASSTHFNRDIQAMSMREGRMEANFWQTFLFCLSRSTSYVHSYANRLFNKIEMGDIKTKQDICWSLVTRQSNNSIFHDASIVGFPLVTATRTAVAATALKISCINSDQLSHRLALEPIYV